MKLALRHLLPEDTRRALKLQSRYISIDPEKEIFVRNETIGKVHPFETTTSVNHNNEVVTSANTDY